MLKIPGWLLSDEQLVELVVTWREVLADEDATPAEQEELDAFEALEAYAETRVDTK